MPVFSYVVRNAFGGSQSGTQEADNAAALVSTLRQRGWLVLDVQPVEKASTVDWLAYLNPVSWLPPMSIDVELSLQQLAVMLRSGLTLLSSLKTIAEYAPKRSMRRIWENVAEQIQEGSSLTDAMKQQRCFNHMVVQLVRVGEQSGTLDKVLTRAAEILERRRLLRTQLLTALSYPALVSVAAIAVAVFMIVSVIPKLQVFLTVLGRKLPAITQTLLDISTFVQVYGVGILIGIVSVLAATMALYLWPPARLMMDRMLLRLPVVGSLQRVAGTAQFASSLGVLLQSGITLVEALRSVEASHRNHYLRQCVAAARNSVLRGSSLAEPLALPGAFMPMLANMVAVGESAGTLDDVLNEVARFHEMRLQASIRRLSAIIEPAIVLVVGGIVGFVYIAFFVALFSVAGGLK
ncbi:MAG: type II secretion system F family protein [Gemmataceae bacterium]